MKIYFQAIFKGIILLSFIFQSSILLNAQNRTSLIPGEFNKFSVTENRFEKVQTFSTLNELEFTIRQTTNGTFVELNAPQYTKTNIEGMPQLPVISKLIEVPTGATPKVTIKSFDMTEYKLSDLGVSDLLLPLQPAQTKSGSPLPFEINNEVYNTNEFYGEELARVEVNGYLRSTQLANLIISPVRYNPVTQTIRVYSNLIVDIDFNGADWNATQNLKAKTNSKYFNSQFLRTINPIALEATRDTMSKMPVKYIIVSDPMFKEQLKPFVEWKTKKGFYVTEAYTDNPEVGNSLTSIKAYLKNLYTSATPADPAPTFVLFVGDVAQIPAHNCGAHYSDVYYVEYTGDYMPEIYYGRFSANNTAELQPQIDKTLYYEKYQIADPSYLNEVVMIAGADAGYSQKWGNGQINYGTTYYFNEDHNLTSHTYLQPEPSGGNYSQNIKANLSSGVSYANYTAHGSPNGWADPSFTMSDIPNMTNVGKYPLMVGNCCETNVYNSNTFGEALLRAENKGALGYIGASNSTYWDEDYWWGVGFGTVAVNATYEQTGLGAYDRTFHDHGEPRSDWYTTMEQMNFAGLLAVQESNSSRKQYYWEIYCLMGDPSTMVYFSEPPAMSYSALPLLPLGTTDFEIQTEPYAFVALTRNNVIHGVTEADSNGLAVLQLTPFTTPGYASIVMTKQNFQPYIDSILVASPNGAYLLLSDYEFNDDGGNNNQIPEYDETIGLSLTYNNYGNTSAVNAVSTLTISNPYVEILNPTYTWENIPSNNQAIATNAFQIHLKDGIPDLSKLIFNLTTTFDTSSFVSSVETTVQAPRISNLDFIIDDVTAGNGNGQFEPGETIYLKLPVKNTGHCGSEPVSCEMFAFNSNYITIEQGTDLLNALAPSDVDTAYFKFTISQDAPFGSTFTMHISSSAGMYSDVTSIIPQIGNQFEDFETGNFNKYSWKMENTPWVISNQSPYAGNYSAKSGSIGNNGKSTMKIEGNVMQDDFISFYKKTGTQANFDYLNFYIDSVLVKSWSGTTPWEKFSYFVTSGKHTFIWSYEKSPTTLVQPDAVWVDDIQFPPMSQAPQQQISVDITATKNSICLGNSTQLYAFATGGVGNYTYSWTPVEGLNNPNIYNPIASPTQTTTYTVTVTSLLFSATKSIEITVTPGPAAPVIHKQNADLISNYTTGNQWYNSEGPIVGQTSQTFTPTSTNNYYCIYTDASGCISEASNVIRVEFVNNELVEKDIINIFPNPFSELVQIQYSLKNSENVKINLYNTLGVKVKQFNVGMQDSGNHTFSINTNDIAKGIYLCEIIRGNNKDIKKIIKK